MRASGKSSANRTKNSQAGFSVGDIFFSYSNKKYNLYKLLAVDEPFECYHVLRYDPLDRLPGEADIDNLSVYIYHSPFHKSAFAGSTLLTNRPVTEDDLIGYYEYLRH